MDELSRRHDTLIRQMACIIDSCRNPRSVPHHIDSKRKSHDLLTLPLCHSHHQGPGGIHGNIGKRAFELYFGTEYDLLAKTWAKMPPEHVEAVKTQLREDLWKRMQAHGGQRLFTLLKGSDA